MIGGNANTGTGYDGKQVMDAPCLIESRDDVSTRLGADRSYSSELRFAH